MQQEATEELVCVQAHQLPLVAVCGVTPAEAYPVAIQGDQSVVGNRDAMRVRAEIAQDVLRTSEGALGIDHPVMAEQSSQPCCEPPWISQRQEVVAEPQ